MRAKVLIVLAILFLASCDGGSSANNNFRRMVVWGKVVDFSTQAGIADATVNLHVGTTVKTVTTADDNEATTGYNEAGDFQITDVPDGRHRLRVEQTGYAVYEEWLTLVPSGDSSDEVSYYYAVNGDTDGKVQLTKGCDLMVYVSNEDGVAVSGAVVYAVPAATNVLTHYSDGFSGVWAQPEIASAATGADGSTALSGLSQVGTYDLYVPAFDNTSDGIYDYQTTKFNDDYGCDDSVTTLHGTLNPARRDDDIRVVGGSFETNYYPANNYAGGDPVADWRYLVDDDAKDTDGDGDGAAWGIDPGTGTITFVFNYPVTYAADGFAMTYFKDLVTAFDSDDDPILTHDQSQEVPVTVTASAADTVLTLSLDTDAAWVVNEGYGLRGSVSALVNGKWHEKNFNGGVLYDFDEDGDADVGLGFWYVFSSDVWTIEDVTADNYNGLNDSDVAAQVYLEFPEYVYGTAYVVKIYDESIDEDIASETVYFSAPTEVDLKGGDMVTNEADVAEDGDAILGCSGTSGCDEEEPSSTAVYRVAVTGVLLGDHNPDGDSARRVTVIIDAYDYEGNHIQGEVTLPIQ